MKERETGIKVIESSGQLIDFRSVIDGFVGRQLLGAEEPRIKQFASRIADAAVERSKNK